MIAASEPFLGPERRHEDEAGDRGADVRDHVEQPRDHGEPERVARAEEPGGQSLRGAGDRRDDDDADRPAGDRLGDPLPHGQPARVLPGHEHARQRPLHVRDVGQEEETDEEDREGGQEEPEEAAGDAEHGLDRVGHRHCDRLGALPERSRRRRCRRRSRALADSRRLSTVAGRSWRKSRTLPTSGASSRRARSVTAIAVPRTVIVAASPRDMFVFVITKRTGYSKTRARKMPTKTIRNVSPIAQNAARTPIAAATSRIVRMGSTNSTRRAPPGSMPLKRTQPGGCLQRCRPTAAGRRAPRVSGAA